VEGMLDEEGKLKKVTSACAPLIFSGGKFEKLPHDRMDAFVCAPEANVVKRIALEIGEQGNVEAYALYQGEEFLASTDETFRPVFLSKSYDDCLYIVDMRRGIIQHKTYMTSYLRKQLQEKGLDEVVGKGRIYRIRLNVKEPPSDFSSLSDEVLVKLLVSPKNYYRNKAQQLLVERQAVEVEKELIDLVRRQNSIHALWTLEGSGKLTPELLEECLDSYDPDLVWTALQMFALLPEKQGQVGYPFFKTNDFSWSWHFKVPAYGRLAKNNPGVAFEFFAEFLAEFSDDSLASDMVTCVLPGQEQVFLAFLKKRNSLPPDHPIFSMLQTAIANRKSLAEKPPSPRLSTDQLTHGLKLYNQLCAACHRPGGEGIPNVAPPLLHSKTASGSPEKIADIILHGLDKLLEINGKKVVFNNAMPAFKDNPALTQKDVEAIAAYVKNAFGEVRTER
ncbi:MAG: c-type cytochrome, partial [Bacteroidota bacterium]